ncbi:MAG: cupin domain-containing protein [Candidatus Latescibacteria bacterium]|nr:cupin domain-containing protein [Candidatus Latescibacterota bacterium]
MPIQKITDFIHNKKGNSVLLSAVKGSNGTIDSIPEMSVTYVELQPGEEVKPHTHNRAEVYVFLTGRAKVLTGSEIKEVTTGDVALAPIGTAHAIKVIGNETLRFYAFNSPPASTCPVVPASEEHLWKWRSV